MHPTVLGTILGTTLILHSCIHPVTMATVNTENMIPAIEPETDGSALKDKWDPDMEYLSSYLEQLLRDGEIWQLPSSPLLYVEDVPSSVYSEEVPEDDDGIAIPWKRSRYYRRYPWKRQNGRQRTQYADSSRYMCNPTREDVFQLLVALHEAREGNTRRTVNFCNRKRPAGAIFTNIRFLGRRK
ncbi:hypothetical protein L9F63_008644 [Diploptera punctata]|uniref:Uncharacterized protein n=1 Tax=Diploptera punctata TaxID=6984 RepID=A0AAD8E1Z0_DIPPU|nr:hypothetical protein L9F63_008644 [Diploptera punctata]